MFSPHSCICFGWWLIRPKAFWSRQLFKMSRRGKLVTEVTLAVPSSLAHYKHADFNLKANVCFMSCFLTFQIQPNIMNEWVTSMCDRMHALFWSFHTFSSSAGVLFHFLNACESFCAVFCGILGMFLRKQMNQKAFKWETLKAFNTTLTLCTWKEMLVAVTNPV